MRLIVEHSYPTVYTLERLEELISEKGEEVPVEIAEYPDETPESNSLPFGTGRTSTSPLITLTGYPLVLFPSSMP